eukprot:COSAG06_NODE_1779_length_8414_cov_9.276248_9_plen_133_part_01
MFEAIDKDGSGAFFREKRNGLVCTMSFSLENRSFAETGSGRTYTKRVGNETEKRFLVLFSGELDHDEVRKGISFAPFDTKMHHFTKTGSGQSQGKLKKERCVFLQFRKAMSRLGLGLSEEQVVQCIDVLDNDR